ncbi:hypothetical protein GJ496_010858 [Pomphorhynchus laevis]|nr:hypothetical protein GJ496_010858 [Pomphorhynchus laevis]
MQSNWYQRIVGLNTRKRGVYLVTDEISNALPELKKFKVGLAHIHLLHTSASLCLNENWDPTVRQDMEMFISRLVPENLPYKHAYEGPDDMPAHIKNCLIGTSVTVPITDGKFNLGTWQGIYLLEHRNDAHSRNVVITVNGQMSDK